MLRLEFPPPNGVEVFNQIVQNVPNRNKLIFPGASQPFEYVSSDFTFKNNLSGDRSFNCVDKVRHEPSGQLLAKKKVVIKWNKWSQANSDEAFNLQRAIREVINHLTYSQDKHPAVDYLIGFYGFGILTDQINICVELMTGSLTELAHKIYEVNVVFDAQLLRYISYLLVTALDYLKSELSIIHRDIKPDNILYKWDEDCRKMSIKLADFGISRILVESKATTMVATEIYQPPERVQDSDRRYGVESDIWGIGMLLLQLQLGRHPLFKDHKKEESLWEIKGVLIKMKDGLSFDQGGLTDGAYQFISSCLKPLATRPHNYQQLKADPYYAQFDPNEDFDINGYFNDLFD